MAMFTKLKSGDWGIKTQGDVKAGDTVTVSKRDGTTDTVMIEKVIFKNEDITICSIKKKDSHQNGDRVCAECGRNGKLVHDMEDGMLKHYNCCDMPPG